jgi:eukaryotic-like serine/threonine-protein kinase
MNRLGDAPTDLLFGLIALHNDIVAPAVIPGALQAQALEPGRTLADTLVAQGALSAVQRELIESLSGECLRRHDGDTRRTISTLIASPSARERLAQLGVPELTDSMTADLSPASTVAVNGETAAHHDLDRTLAPSPGAVELPRAQIAGYEILEVLGVGGMGIVYKARQPRLDRFVALKMIRGGASARAEDLARFEIEAKAVAAIEHSNFVRIFEIGEHEGLPYFSLEYLPGGSLAKKIDGKPQPFDEAARIVEVLARAMHVAHEHKVIHRDLKPTNILFAADGTLKIADFGLVKRLEDDSGHTSSGSILGTPSYMAPEQARGESHRVGPAADQYALGAILYELLTGRPPFQGTSVLDTLDMVRDREPVPPSQLQPKTPRDIDTICLKCLEKDISRRYPDALALAEDLRKFRSGETILARPVSDVERVSRWCRRNKMVASLIGAVAALLVTGSVGSAVAAVVYRAQSQALAAATTRAEDKRQEAERKEKVAVAAARAAIEQNTSLVEARLDMVDLLRYKLRFVTAIKPEERKELLDKASKGLEDAARAMTDLRRDVDWAPQDEGNNWRALAKAHQYQGAIHLSRNQVKEALARFHQAEEIITKLTVADPADLVMQVNLIKSKRQLGYLTMNQLGDTEGAQSYFKSAIELSKACLAKEPDSDAFKSELANSIGGLAKSEANLGHLEQARDLYRQEIEIRESYSAAHAAVFENRRELAGFYAERAAMYVRMGDNDEARRLYDKVASLRSQNAAEQPDSWPVQNDLALSFNNQASMRFPNGKDPAHARDFHREALEILRKRAKADPEDAANQKVLAETLYYEATCAMYAGDKAGAAAGFQACLTVCKELVKQTDPKGMQYNLMLALGRCGQHVEAAKIAHSLVATPPKDENLYIQAAMGYAVASAGTGDDKQAKKRYTFIQAAFGYAVAAAAAAADKQAREDYTTAAIDCLRNAMERGWNDVTTLKHDTDLEPIRNAPGFQALVQDLEKNVSGTVK